MFQPGTGGQVALQLYKGAVLVSLRTRPLSPRHVLGATPAPFSVGLSCSHGVVRGSEASRDPSAEPPGTVLHGLGSLTKRARVWTACDEPAEGHVRAGGAAVRLACSGVWGRLWVCPCGTSRRVRAGRAVPPPPPKALHTQPPEPLRVLTAPGSRRPETPRAWRTDGEALGACGNLTGGTGLQPVVPHSASGVPRGPPCPLPSGCRVRGSSGRCRTVSSALSRPIARPLP